MRLVFLLNTVKVSRSHGSSLEGREIQHAIYAGGTHIPLVVPFSQCWAILSCDEHWAAQWISASSWCQEVVHHERTWQRLWSGGGGNEEILQRKVLHPFAFFSSLFSTWLQREQTLRMLHFCLSTEDYHKQPHHFKKTQGSFLIPGEAGNVYLFIYSGQWIFQEENLTTLETNTGYSLCLHERETQNKT